MNETKRPVGYITMANVNVMPKCDKARAIVTLFGMAPMCFPLDG